MSNRDGVIFCRSREKNDQKSKVVNKEKKEKKKKKE